MRRTWPPKLDPPVALMAALLLLSVAALPSRAEDIAPGSRIQFTAPLGGDSECETLGEVPGVDCDVNLPPADGYRLEARVISEGTFFQARARSRIWNELRVVGAAPGATCTAQISGRLACRGEMFIRGHGKVDTTVRLSVIDVTEPGDETPVLSRDLFNVHHISNVINPHEPALQMGNRVDDLVDFGFEAMLQSGRTYRLVVTLEVFGKLSWVGGDFRNDFRNADKGRGMEVTQLLVTLEDDLLDDLARLDEKVDGVRAVADDTNALVRALDNGAILTRLTRIEDGVGSVQTVADAIRTGVDAVDSRTRAIDDRTLLIEGTVDDTNAIVHGLGDGLLAVQSELQMLGSRVDALSDLVQGLENADIETSLRNGTESISLILPAEHGGKLEKVIDFVDAQIRRVEAAGLPIGRARIYHGFAVVDYDLGFYRFAFSNLKQSYEQLLDPDANLTGGGDDDGKDPRSE